MDHVRVLLCMYEVACSHFDESLVQHVTSPQLLWAIFSSLFSCTGRGNRSQAATMGGGRLVLLRYGRAPQHLGGYRKTCWAQYPHVLPFYQVDLAGGSLCSARVEGRTWQVEGQKRN